MVKTDLNKGRRVLYISYDCITEPLSASQVLPYLRGLAGDRDIFLLTFNKKRLSPAQLDDIRRKNGLKGLIGLNYHKSPTLPATAFDIICGTVISLALVKRHGISFIHARSYVACAIAFCLKRLAGVPYIFDVRGLLADERADSGDWPRDSAVYRITKFCEKRFFDEAAAIILLSHAGADIVRDISAAAAAKITVIPTCVDTGLFSGSGGPDVAGRHTLKMIYIGSLGTWYMLPEMLDFFKAARAVLKDVTLSIATRSDPSPIRALLKEKAIAESDVDIFSEDYERIPRRLGGHDASLFFIKPSFSKKLSCPTKFAESLSMGLPVVTNAGVGDLDDFIRRNAVGVVVDGFHEEAYKKAAEQLSAMLREKRPLADRCRVLATKEFSLEGGIRKYDSLYRSMASAAGNRVLFIVPYPSEGASNRLRVEQYLPYLDRDGIRYSVRPFVGKRFYRILYSRGRHFAKACFFALSIIGRCLDVLRALKYDIVFVHREALPIGSIAIEKAFLKTGRRMIFDFDDAIFLPSTSESNNYMERFKDPGKVARIIALSGHVIAGNGYLKEYAGKFNRNVTVIPTPIDADRYRPDAAAALRPDGAVTIGWIGSFTTRVYLDFLRGVFGRLKAKYPALRLIFVGNWSGMKDRIEWAEYKEWSLDDEPADIRSFDIGIMPMPDDMWTRGKCGFKIILYMSCSIPVVSSPVGVNLEIIKDKENGLLARTDEEWFMALSQLVEDATLRGRLGAAGRRTVEERYSVRRTAPLFISVLRETSGRCFEF